LGDLEGSTLTVAMPGPFDYAAGIGRYKDVAKFDALNGVDVRAGLFELLPRRPAAILFLNDADAFGLGEWVAGALRGRDRGVAITLGTGVGSAFVDRGRIVCSGPCVPPGGNAHELTVEGRPLEEIMSTRAIVAAYASSRSGAAARLDVREIARRAHDGDVEARQAIGVACFTLGAALAPWVVRFEAQALVVGGGLTASWSLIEPPLLDGIASAGFDAARVPVLRSADSQGAVEVGAAWHGWHSK
jgi:glucokinase